MIKHLLFPAIIITLMATTVMVQTAARLEFELKDQFDRICRAEDYRGQVVILVGSDKDGSEFNAPWIGAIYGSIRGERNMTG